MRDRNKIVIGPIPADDAANIRSIDDRLQGVETGRTDIPGTGGVDEGAVREIVETILVDYAPVPGSTTIVIGLPPGDASMYVSPDLVTYPIDVELTQRVCTNQSGSYYPLQIGRYLVEDTPGATGYTGAHVVVGTRTDSGVHRGVVFDTAAGVAASFAMSAAAWGFHAAGTALVAEPVSTSGTSVEILAGGTLSLVTLTAPASGYSLVALGTASNPDRFCVVWTRNGYQDVWLTTHTASGTQVAANSFMLTTPFFSSYGWARVENGLAVIFTGTTYGEYYVKDADTTGSFATATLPAGIARHQVGLGSGMLVARSGTSLYIVTVASGMTSHKAGVFDVADVTYGLAVAAADVYRWGGYVTDAGSVPKYMRLELGGAGAVYSSILTHAGLADGAASRPLSLASGNVVYVAQADIGNGSVFRVAG